MTRLTDDRGFTLVETLLAAALGIVILFAAGGLIEVAARSERATSDRVQAVARGRLVMELMTRPLRSQVCVSDTQPALLVAEDDQVSVVASLAEAPEVSGQLQLDQRTLRFEPIDGSDTEGRIVEEVFPGTGTPPTVAFATEPSSRRVLVDRVSRTQPGAPIFRYHRYNADTAPEVDLLATPVPFEQRQVTVRIDVAFDSYPDRGGDPARRTVYKDQVFSRTADPTDPTRSPKCI